MISFFSTSNGGGVGEAIGIGAGLENVGLGLNGTNPAGEDGAGVGGGITGKGGVEPDEEDKEDEGKEGVVGDETEGNPKEGVGVGTGAGVAAEGCNAAGLVESVANSDGLFASSGLGAALVFDL